VITLQQQLADATGSSLGRLMEELDQELEAIAQEVERYLQQLEDITLPD